MAWALSSTHQPHPSDHQGASRPRQHYVGLCQSSTDAIDESQTLKAFWPCHLVRRLIEILTKSQRLKACWPCHAVQALIGMCSKSQTMKTCWPRHIVQVLMKYAPKVSQALLACWPCHVVQVLIEICSKSQTLKACWPCHVVRAMSRGPGSDRNHHQKPAGHVTLSRFWLLKCLPKVTFWRPGGNLTWWSLWLNRSLNVKVWRLLGKLCSKAGCSLSPTWVP